LMQLLMGMSIRRYFPAMGTAGFERIWVNGCRREPLPPPMMTPKTSLIDGIVTSMSSLQGCFVSSMLAMTYVYYLLKLKSCRNFEAIKTNGYANRIIKSISAKSI